MSVYITVWGIIGTPVTSALISLTPMIDILLSTVTIVPIASTVGGKIAEIKVKVDDQVATNDILMVVE